MMCRYPSAQHVIPRDDVIAHESTIRCVCRPCWKAIWVIDCGVHWLFVHHSADGRELSESDYMG